MHETSGERPGGPGVVDHDTRGAGAWGAARGRSTR